MFYSKKNRIFICVVLTIVMFILTMFICGKFIKNTKEEAKNQVKTSKEQSITNIVSEVSAQIPSTANSEEKITQQKKVAENQYKENKWRIIIPKIYLDAPIIEGTSKEVLRRGVGHFEQTSKENGNVVLAAHNRGYKYNFFKDIKKLAIGDTITYKTEGGKKIYKVTQNKEIQETDFSCLENTKENTLTLITCVENKPAYRTCVKAIQI